jgi:hypothetical protein
MQTLDAPFPVRPLNVKPLKPQKLELLLVASVFFLAAGWFFSVQFGPDLIRDIRIGNSAVAAPKAIMTLGKCRARALFVYWCDIPIANGSSHIELHYFFVDEPSAKFSAAVLGAKDNPQDLTTDLGLEKLWNRAAVLGVILLFCVSPVIILPATWMRNRRTGRDFASLSDQGLQFIAVTLQSRRNPKSTQWQYKVPGRRRWLPVGVTMPYGASPFFLDPWARTALAVTPQIDPEATPMLLDADLTTLDLTEAERQALQQWRALRLQQSPR